MRLSSARVVNLRSEAWDPKQFVDEVARALQWARTRLAALRRADYPNETAYKRIRTRRRNAVRRLERLLALAEGR